MILNAWMHLLIMLGLVAFSFIKKPDLRFILILCVYGTAWQVSEHFSYLENMPLFDKLVFQSTITIFLIYSVTFLKYTRFTLFFMALLFIGVASFFTVVMFDSYASNASYNYAIDVFSLINIQLIYLELLALVGITFDMGSDKGIFARSFDGDLHRSTSSFGVVAYT